MEDEPQGADSLDWGDDEDDRALILPPAEQKRFNPNLVPTLRYS